MLQYGFITMKDAIVQAGAKVLREKAKPVAKKDIGGTVTVALVKKMKKALAGEKFGVAIAAPQVGSPLRAFMISGKAFLTAEDIEAEKKAPPDKIFINPELHRLSKKKRIMSEGCLSVREKYGTVLRHEKASVKALDERGKPFTYHGSGLIAHIFQHECDHLEGILYTDKATSLEESDDLADMQKQRAEENKKHG